MREQAGGEELCLGVRPGSLGWAAADGAGEDGKMHFPGAVDSVDPEGWSSSPFVPTELVITCGDSAPKVMGPCGPHTAYSHLFTVSEMGSSEEILSKVLSIQQNATHLLRGLVRCPLVVSLIMGEEGTGEMGTTEAASSVQGPLLSCQLRSRSCEL